MSVPVIAFFSNKGGVGNTSLVYHLSWMLAELGYRVLAADLDPQSNLTAALLDDERLEHLWASQDRMTSIATAVEPLTRGIGDVVAPELEVIDGRLALVIGDLSLSRFEGLLSEVWSKCLARDERAFRVTSAFWRVMQHAASAHGATAILMDLGPGLGAINRAALISSDHVVILLSPDVFSLQGLHNLGPALREWRQGWEERVARNPVTDLPLPAGGMQPTGYIVLQHPVRLDRPVKDYERRIGRIPGEYSEAVLGRPTDGGVPVKDDPECLALLKHYRSLMALAQEARKPMFLLKPADGAIGCHYQAVQSAFEDFRKLAQTIASRTGLQR